MSPEGLSGYLQHAEEGLIGLSEEDGNGDKSDESGNVGDDKHQLSDAHEYHSDGKGPSSSSFSLSSSISVPQLHQHGSSKRKEKPTNMRHAYRQLTHARMHSVSVSTLPGISGGRGQQLRGGRNTIQKRVVGAMQRASSTTNLLHQNDMRSMKSGRTSTSASSQRSHAGKQNVLAHSVSAQSLPLSSSSSSFSSSSSASLVLIKRSKNKSGARSHDGKRANVGSRKSVQHHSKLKSKSTKRKGMNSSM